MPNYQFNNSTVADRLTELIDRSINYVSKKNISNKYFRGVTGSVYGNMADVYLFGSNTPITNVKIGSGVKHLTEGEDVLINAVAGKLHNSIIDKRIIDYNLLYEDEIENFLTIDDFSENTHTWTCTTPINAELIDDKDYYKIYSLAKRTKYNVLTPSYYFYSNISLDLTALHDGQASEDTDFIYLGIYISDAYEDEEETIAVIDNVVIRFYSGSDYFTLVYNGLSILNGWNGIKSKKKDFTSTGTPNWAAITRVEIGIEYTSTPSAEYFATLGYLGMGKLYYSSVSNISADVDLTQIENDITTLEGNVTDLQDDITDLDTNKQDVNDLLTDISGLISTGILAKSSTEIYLASILGTTYQIAVTDETATGGNITVGLANNTIEIDSNSTRFNVLYKEYTWNTGYHSLDIGAGATISVKTTSHTDNAFRLMNNLYIDAAGNIDDIYTDNASSIEILRNGIDFYITDSPSNYNDNIKLSMRDTMTTYYTNISIKKGVSSAWASPSGGFENIKVLEVGDTGSVYAQRETYKNIKICQNLYVNDSLDEIYMENGHATMYEQKNGEHIFYYSSSGSTGGAVTLNEAVKINSSGNFSINTHKVYIQSTTPSSPTIGDIWFDIS